MHAHPAVPGPDADFLHLACLNYNHDRPAFRQRARDMLGRDPALAVRDIWSAACVGDTGAVARMLDTDPSLVDARGGWFDWEPLLYAAYSRVNAPGRSTLDTARLLIDRGANPNAFYLWGGDYRFTALTGAFGEGEQGPVNQPAHPEWEALARLLLDAGANPNDGQALYNRMFAPGDRCLEILLEYGLNRRHRINWRSGRGRVLDYQLDWAVRNHHAARAKLLVEHGADPTRRLDDGTSLSKAAMLAGHPGLADFLVSRGAKPPRLDRIDRFASECMAGDVVAAREAIRRDPDLPRQCQARRPGLVEDAAGANRLDAVALMADLGFDLERGTVGSPLHMAAVHGHLEMVELLVERGVDVSAKDPEGRTAGDWAEWRGEEECEAYLSNWKL